MQKSFLLLLISSLYIFSVLHAQIDHYETIIYDDDIWRYRPATKEQPSNWMQANFNDTYWDEGEGGFGYGDNDDATIVENNNGVYLRKEFDIIDISHIEKLILDADYDDGFVAYLNGVEVARSLVEGNPPPYNASTSTDHEAALYQGGIPERFEIDKNILQENSNTLAIQVVNFGNNSSDMTARFFLSAGINEGVYNYGDVPDWFEQEIDVVFESSNLPLVFINTNGQAIENEPRIVAHMGIIDNGEGNRNYLTDPFNHYDGRIEIELHGNSSIFFFDKKNLRIETQTETGENNNVALLGMPEENDWVLHGPFSDKTLLRNVLSYHLGGLTQLEWTPRTRYCEVFVNDDYRGIYVLTEKIKRDKNRLDIANVRPEDTEGDELTGDYLFRIDWENDFVPQDGWYSNNGDYPYFYGYVEPSYKDIVPVQRTYIQNHIAEFENAILGPNYLQVYKNYIDIGSLVDYFLVSELTKHIDAFKLSFYMYKKKDSNGGKIHFGPLWDFNLGYGNFDFECPPQTDGWIYECTSVTHWFDKLIEIPEIHNRLHCRWKELREVAFKSQNIMAFIDEQTALLDEAQARNFERFPILGEYVWPNSFVGNSYDDEINFLKNFVLLRLRWIDENLLPIDINDCSELTTTNAINETIKVRSYPNPFAEILALEYSNATYSQAEICIYTIEGKLQHKSLIKSTETLSITTQNWPSGQYIYNIHKEGNILSYGKLIK